MALLALLATMVSSQIVPQFMKVCSQDTHCSTFGDSGATCAPVELGRCLCSSGYSNVAYNNDLYYACLADSVGNTHDLQQKTNMTIWMQHRDSVECTINNPQTDYTTAEIRYANTMKSLIMDATSTDPYSAKLHCLRNGKVGSVIHAKIPLQNIFDSLTQLSTLINNAFMNDAVLTSVLGLTIDKLGASSDPDIKLCTETVELGTCCVPPLVEWDGGCVEPHLVWNPRISTDDGSMHSGYIAAIVCSISLIIIVVVVVSCYRASAPREGEFDTSVPQDIEKEQEASKSMKSVKSLKSLKSMKQGPQE